MRRGSWLGLLVACSPGGGVAGCNGTNETAEGGDVVLTDDNNYTYVPTLGMGEAKVQSETDSTVDWSALTTDIRGRPVDPASVEQIYLVEFIGFTQEDLVDKIEANDLYQKDTESAYIFDNSAGVTSTSLSTFSILDNEFKPEDFTEDSTRVWLVSLINHPEGANDVLQSKFITPLDAATETELVFTDDCTTLGVEVNMDDPIPPAEPEIGGNRWTLDWSPVTSDVNGRTWDPLVGDKLQIGWFDATVAEVEAEFLRLDSEADEFYTLNVYGKTGVTDLSDATERSGAAFSGFTSEGVWVAAIACTTCLSPAPLYLAVVDVP